MPNPRTDGLSTDNFVREQSFATALACVRELLEQLAPSPERANALARLREVEYWSLDALRDQTATCPCP